MKRILAAAVAAQSIFFTSVVRADLSADQSPFSAHRGLWIDRWSYNNAADITTMLNRAQSLGITDVMFQVRGQADAYYYKNKDGNGNPIEVYGDHQDPITADYDPLGIAVTEAHKRGIRLHAWTNISPLWRGTTASTNPQHLMNTHDEYWIRKADGTKQPLNSSYTTMNITRADVQAHTNNVLRNIAAQYEVDGIYLDYIRFYENHSGTLAINYPGDAETVGRFTADTGLTFTNPTTDPNRAAYKTWLAANVSNFVRDLRASVHEGRESTQLAAAVWRDAAIGLNDYQQDWKTWMEQGYLDAAMPMIYRKGFGSGGTNMDADSGDLFRTNTDSALNHASNSAVAIAIATYMQTTTTTAYNNVMAQLTYARDHGANGFDIYDYSLFNGTASMNEAKRAVTDFINANSAPPAAVAITNFESGTNNEGYFQQNITFSGTNRNIASGSADRVTTEHHAGAGAQQIIINKTAGATDFIARHCSGIPDAAMPASNVTLGSIGSLSFWLKTTTNDLQVAPAVDDNSANTSTERGYLQNVIADGQWHKYEWFLNDHTHWDGWAGANTNGAVASQFTLDSIQFFGTADSNTLFLDDVSFDAAATAPDQWIMNADGDWSDTLSWSAKMAHWTAGDPPTVAYTGGVPNGVGATANLRRRATAARAVTLDQPVTLGTLNIDNSFGYTIGGTSAMTMDVASGSAQINVINRGSHTISAPIVLNDATTIAVDTGSTLNLTGNLAGGANALTKAGAGLLQVKHVRAGTLAVNGGTLAVTPNGSSTSTSRVASVAISGARLDLTDNHLIITGMSVGTASAGVYSGVSGLVQSGRNGGSWNGNGIVTSMSSAVSLNPLTTLAVASNADLGKSTFGGQAVASTDVLVMYTYGGDANLSGGIDADDYFQIDANYNKSGSVSGFFRGDFNYDGAINGDDYVIIDASFTGQTTPFSSAAPLLEGVSLVPEPGVGVLVLLLMGRRGRAALRTARVGAARSTASL